LPKEYNKYMASGEKAGKEGVFERGLGFLRNIHAAIGAVALGAEVVTGFVVFEAIAIYEGLNALAHEGLRRVVKNFRRPKLKPA
jgi:hypothetical protein